MIPARSRFRGHALRLLTLLFAAATTLYSGVWMYGVRQEPEAFLGISYDPGTETGGLRLLRVEEDSPAERAGLRPGDLLRAIDGRPAVDRGALRGALDRHGVGGRVRLDVVRGDGEVLALDAVLAAPPTPDPRSLSRAVADEILASYPVLFLVVGVTVLLLRPEDLHAWLMALLFAAFIAGAPFMGMEDLVPAPLARFGLLYKIVFYGLSPALFLTFFSVFPEPSPLDRAAPWLKFLWLGTGLAAAVPIGLWALVEGSSAPLRPLQRMDAAWALPVYVYMFGGVALGFVSLVWNALRGSIASRRRSRVVVWGTLVGYLPATVLFGAGAVQHRPVFELAFWVWAPCIMFLFLIPLSFAYAVLKHRVFDLPVLLKRSARYMLVQRGFLVLLLLLGAGSTLVLAAQLPSWMRPSGGQAPPAAVLLGAAFGTLLVWAGSRLQRSVGERIDRAFFRSVYDVRAVLQDLADRARAATSREDLAALIEHHVRAALMPSALAVYLESPRRQLEAHGTEGANAPDVLPDLAFLRELAQRGQPAELRPDRPAEAEALAALAALRPDCLVPVRGRDGRLTGLLVLGPRLSEDPYSGEDRRLLASVASQAGIALESIALAEQIAERLEAERRAAHEMDLARQVQGRLLPSETIPLATLEYAGCCVQARAVGGDYFDFLELGPTRVGLVLADISGKGFPAALLMANLQASLRSRSAEDFQDLAGQLRSVNQLLYRSSEPNRFATLFVGVYDDSTRRLRYANCGHNPPLVVRAGGSLERLLPTAPVLGLIVEEWECTTAHVDLGSGDLLTVYSDGVTEAFSADGEEFGEDRLTEILRRHHPLTLAAVLEEVQSRVQAFGDGEQADDQTLLLARGR